MRVIRVFAQAIDLLFALGVFLASFLLVPPRLSTVVESPVVCAAVVVALTVGIVALVQLLFLREGQTVGKAFFGLRIVSTAPEQPLTVSILFQREVFCKLMTCYFICFPVLLGNAGGHEEATRTKVVSARERAAGRVKEQML